MSQTNQSLPASSDVRFFGDLTANVQLDNVSVSLTDQAPLNAILIHPLTLASLLSTVKGGISISAHDELALDPIKRQVNKLEGVYDTVQKFVDEYGITGPGKLGIDFEGDAPPEDVQQASAEILRESIEQHPLPAFEFQLSHALALAVAKNLIYEKLIDELAAQVGYAAPVSDEAAEQTAA